MHNDYYNRKIVANVTNVFMELVYKKLYSPHYVNILYETAVVP